MYRTDFLPEEVPSDIRQYFEEVEAACGTPWERVVEREKGRTGDPTDHYINRVQRPGQPTQRATYANTVAFAGSVQLTPRGGAHTLTLGFRPACACPPAEPVPCIVLDCYMGSGTSLAVAYRLGRDYIGIDLDARNAALVEKRLKKVSVPLLTGIPNK